MLKKRFFGRKNFPGSAQDLQDAIAAQKDLMIAVLEKKVKKI
jgi:hypothetical protein